MEPAMTLHVGTGLYCTEHDHELIMYIVGQAIWAWYRSHRPLYGVEFVYDTYDVAFQCVYVHILIYIYARY